MAGSKVYMADQIHDGHRFLADDSAIEISESGEILAVHEGGFTGNVIHLDGLLCPGFVNAHCHLELSHMEGIIPEQTGLIPFLQSVTRTRFDFTDEQKKAARHTAYNTMLKQGVVAVGDIANITDTLDVRALGRMHFHTFVESIGFTESAADGRLVAASQVLDAFTVQPADGVMLRQSITPHAPYSVSEKLFRLIDAAADASRLSIHNQESAAEDEYYHTKTGAVRDLLEGFGINDDFFVPSGKSSLQTYLPWISEEHELILVHNTFSTRDDIAFANARARQPFWCLCPNANLYIEGRLPDVPMLALATENICIGTDSLASNSNLCIVNELRTLYNHFLQVDWDVLLKWGTYNGARALGMDHRIGSLEVGKTPGLIQVVDIDSDNPIVVRIDSRK